MELKKEQSRWPHGAKERAVKVATWSLRKSSQGGHMELKKEQSRWPHGAKERAVKTTRAAKAIWS